MARGRYVVTVAAVLSAGVLMVACSSGSPSSGPSPSSTESGDTVPLVSGGDPGSAAYLVYWDQNEEVDFLSMPSGVQGQLLPAWDLNGQVCVLPGGRFVGGYDPTLPNQHNLGGLKPYKQPADGEELDEPNGSFSGQTLYVPGPYKMRGQSIGSDSPPSANGVFNNNQTYTGCAVDSHHNVFANDIATAQGSFPPPSSGRLVEWFAPSYTTSCIVYGPTSGGYGPHHTDGTGGLAQPGTMAVASNDDLLVPNVGTSSVLRFAHASLPTSAAQCPGGIYPRSQGPGLDVLQEPVVRGRDRQGPDVQLLRRQQLHRGPRPSVWVTAERSARAGAWLRARHDGGRARQEPQPVQPVRHGLRPRRDAVLRRHPHHLHRPPDRLWAGLLRGPGDAGDLQWTANPSAPVTVATGFDFPTSVTVCVPARCDVPTRRGRSLPPVRPRREPRAGPRADLGTPRHRRLRLRSMHPWQAASLARPGGPRGAASVAAALAAAARGGCTGRQPVTGTGVRRRASGGRYPRPARARLGSVPGPGTGRPTATTPSTRSTDAPR
jgi:hypothetical protein